MGPGWLVSTLFAVSSACGDFTGTQPCPLANVSLSEGSSEMIVPNISAVSKILVLCKRNHSSSAWEDILLIRKGNVTELSGYKSHFYISDHGLAIKNASKELTGQYQLAYFINGFCTHQFFLDVQGTQPCPLANVSLSEGSSEMIVPNISAMSNILVLCKRNHSSSAWEDILLIRKGNVTEMNGYKSHFYISDHGLAIKNASKELTGQYQLAYFINGFCTHQFFLDVQGSEGTYNHTYWIIGGTLILMVSLAICCYRKLKRREEERSEPNLKINLALSAPEDCPRPMEGSCLPACSRDPLCASLGGTGMIPEQSRDISMV